jgi:phosphohistidine phosphatase SixA
VCLVGILLITGTSIALRADQPPKPINSDITVVYVVRHAEKVDEGRDPRLSKKGRERAETLAWMLKDAAPQAIYATSYKRTRDTVTPLSEQCKVEITTYDDVLSLSKKICSENRGKSVLVCGHSNTVPELLGAFGTPIPETILDGFDDLFIVILRHAADGAPPNATLQRLRYVATH